MMNTAMDRWGASSSSDKENDSKTKSGDSKTKRKPLKLKQQILQKSESDNSLKETSDNKSYKSSNSSGSHKSSGKRQSGPVTAILGDIEADLESIANLPPPPMDNIVAEDEEIMNEVSTIAGDTYSGVEMDASVAEAVPPYNDESYAMPVPPGAAQFDDAMITPTYSVLRQDKKRLSRVFNVSVPLDDEETTLTENPTGEDEYGFQDDSALEQVEQGKSQKKVVDKSFDDDDDDDDDDYDDYEFDDEKQFQESEEPKSPPRRTRRFRCMMFAGFALAFLLLVGIAALGYTLYAIRNEDEGALSLFTKEFWDNAGDKMAFWKKDEMDGFATIPPTSYTSWVSSSSGTSEPTEWSPTEVPITEEMETVMAMVTALTFQKDWLNATALTDPSSMQYQVMEWLSEDPALENYSQEQVMQRYALGCFYRGVLGDDIPLEEDVADAKNHEDIRETWMTYAEECENWKNTETKKNQKGPCNDLGQIRSIHLENAALTGTLASELALLSDSLESLYLTKNQLYGTIPTAYGQLTNLKRLQLSRNTFEGTVDGPELLAPLEKLEIIGLGGNKLSGPIPGELGSMPKMVYINIPYNDFTGSIPATWTSEKLEHVSFAMNELTGEIPEQLTGMKKLKRLFLTGNNLVGNVSEICVLPYVNATYNVTYNKMDMDVDCDKVHCDCCGCQDVRPPPFIEVDIDLPELDINASFATAIDSNVSNATFVYEVTMPVNSTANVSVGTEDVTTETPANSTGNITVVPFVDDASFDEALSVLNGGLPAAQASEPYGCQSISVGFQCYTSGWSIDFELSNNDCAMEATTDYDVVALFPFEGDVMGPSKVGTLKNLDNALFWSSSCGLTECDGVIANGQVYYRNTYPSHMAPLSPPWWPVAPNSMMQVQWIRVDESGTAIVLAESAPFLVSNKC